MVTTALGPDEGLHGLDLATDTVFHAGLGRLGHLVCLAAANGEEIWRQEGLGELEAPPAVSGCRQVLSVDRDGWLRAHHLATGRCQWQVKIDDDSRCPPAVAGHRALVSTHEGTLWAFDQATAVVLWSYPLGAQSDSAPSVTESGHLLVAAGPRLLCLAPDES